MITTHAINATQQIQQTQHTESIQNADMNATYATQK